MRIKWFEMDMEVCSKGMADLKKYEHVGDVVFKNLSTYMYLCLLIFYPINTSLNIVNEFPWQNDCKRIRTNFPSKRINPIDIFGNYDECIYEVCL